MLLPALLRMAYYESMDQDKVPSIANITGLKPILV